VNDDKNSLEICRLEIDPGPHLQTICHLELPPLTSDSHVIYLARGLQRMGSDLERLRTI
jgi:hypothetical protein